MRTELKTLLLFCFFTGISVLVAAQDNCADQLAEREEKITLLEESREYLKEEIASRDSTLKQLALTVEVMTAQLNQLQTSLTEKEKEREELTITIQNLQADLAKIEEKNQPQRELKKALALGEQERSQLASELAALNQQKQGQDKMIRNLQTENQQLKDELATRTEGSKQSTDRITQLEQQVLTLESVIAELVPLKQQILDKLEAGVSQLYQSPPAQGAALLPDLERQLVVALSFKGDEDVQHLKNKVNTYQRDLAVIVQARELLTQKYSPSDNQQQLSAINEIFVPIFQTEKERLSALVAGYCVANNEIVAIIKAIHKYGNLNIRRNLMTNALNSLSFPLDGYPFLQAVIDEKRNHIAADTVPYDLSEVSCEE